MSWGGGGSLRDGWLDFAWRAYESCVACVTDLSLQYFEAREPAQPIPRLGSFGSLKLQKSHLSFSHSMAPRIVLVFYQADRQSNLLVL